jgi:hypothetical protein
MFCVGDPSATFRISSFSRFLKFFSLRLPKTLRKRYRSYVRNVFGTENMKVDIMNPEVLTRDPQKLIVVSQGPLELRADRATGAPYLDKEGKLTYSIAADVTPPGERGLRVKIRTSDTSAEGVAAGEILRLSGVEVSLYEMNGKVGVTILAEKVQRVNPGPSAPSVSSPKPAPASAD